MEPTPTVSHLAYSLEPSAGMPGYVWVGGAWDVNTEDPSPCGGPSPTSPCGDATLHGLRAGAQAGGWVTGWAYQSESHPLGCHPTKGGGGQRNCGLASKHAGCQSLAVRKPRSANLELGEIDEGKEVSLCWISVVESSKSGSASLEPPPSPPP